MAIDEALLAVIPGPVLRVYRWARPAVSFGYFQPWEPVRAAHATRDPVRRWTGGGTVLHGEDFTYSLLIPREIETPPPAESYRLIHNSLCRALADARLPAQPAPASSANNSGSCFENPVHHDILVDNRKVAGAAQRRARAGLLHQGSIQTLDLPPNFAPSFASHLAPEVHAQSFNLTLAAEKLAAEKYGAPSWLERCPAAHPRSSRPPTPPPSSHPDSSAAGAARAPSKTSNQ